MRCPDGGIGSSVWPGALKIQEECGELITALGKLLAFPDGQHPAQGNIIANVEEEISDVSAAIEYFVQCNRGTMRVETITQRAANKLNRFIYWHRERKAAS